MQELFDYFAGDPIRVVEYIFASITAFGVMAFLWGLFDDLNYLMASGHDHERENGRIYMMWGATILVFTFVVWEGSRFLFHRVLGF